MATYQIVSGAPNGAYMFLEPCASLKTLDAAPQRSHNMFQAMGDDGVKRFAKMAGEAIAQTETLLFAIDPEDELRITADYRGGSGLLDAQTRGARPAREGCQSRRQRDRNEKRSTLYAAMCLNCSPAGMLTSI